MTVSGEFDAADAPLKVSVVKEETEPETVSMNSPVRYS